MQVNIQEFLKDAQITEQFYPGKRIIKPCKHTGEFKSHCVILDWRDPDEIRIEIKAGMTGKQLEPKVLRNYPVCFQMPTYVRIKVTNDNADEEDEDEKSKGKGSSGSGGKKPAQKKRSLHDVEVIARRFESSATGQIPGLGKIKEMVVLGVQIAKHSFEHAFTELTHQIAHAKVSATELLAKTGEFIRKVQPPAFIKPKGDETVKYKYDREKNANIGMRLTPG